MADAVAIKLPALWTDNVDAWFMQTEAQFALNNITQDKTKFNYLIAALDSATAKRAMTIIRNPPATGKYPALRDHLKQKFGLTDYERAAAINAITGLGEQKPSELMDSLLCLLGDHEPDLMFRFHFLQCLPDYVRGTLALSTEDDPHALAEEADRIFVAGRPRDFAAMETVALTDKDSSVDRVFSGGKKRTKKSPVGYNNQSRFCFYHARFGDKAHRCEAPCTWPSQQGNEHRGQQF